MTGVVLPLRTGQGPRPVRVPVPADSVSSEVCRALYVAQRSIDEGMAGSDLGDWYTRRDSCVRGLLTHLDPDATGAELDTRVGRLIAWLDLGARRPEQIAVYARTLCVPHI